MASPLLLRNAESISGDMIQRILGSQFAGMPSIGGIGTGFAPGGVGAMNKNWLGSGAPTGHMNVTATGTTMVLTIAGGWAVVIRDAGASSFDPRAFLAELQASATVTVTANSTGSTRNDTVCLKIDQNTAPSSDGSNLVSVVLLAGASGGGLANAPADGNLYLPLANVAVANGAASISQANVTDLRMSGVGSYCPYGGRAHAGATQSTTSGVFAKVNLDTADNDPNGNFDLANHWYVVPTRGRYQVNGEGHFNAAALTDVLAIISKGGTGNLTAVGNEGTMISASVGDIIVCNAGDTLELDVRQSSGAAQSTAVASGFNYLSVNFLGPA